MVRAPYNKTPAAGITAGPKDSQPKEDCCVCETSAALAFMIVFLDFGRFS
jgi:hypothetical protein